MGLLVTLRNNGMHLNDRSILGKAKVLAVRLGTEPLAGDHCGNEQEHARVGGGESGEGRAGAKAGESPTDAKNSRADDKWAIDF